MSARRPAGPARIPIAICVPARQEAARLPLLFEAVERLHIPLCVDVALCLMLDGCDDGSADAAARHATQSRHRVHVAEAPWQPPNAGRARDAAMRLGMAAVGEDGIVLTTDADSVPHPDWLLAMVAGLNRADLVAGDVIRSGGGGNADQDRIEHYYASLFTLRRQIDPVEWEAPQTHHHSSGANMGLRAATYAKLGGFIPLERGEDARLIDDAARAGLRVRRDAASVVHTSNRRTGRAAGGLATMLRDLDREGLAGIAVAHPADQVWQYRMHAGARAAWNAPDMKAFAASIGLTADHLHGVARDCPNAEAFAMRAVPVPPTGMRHIPFPVAEAALATMIAAAPPAEAA